MDGCTVTKTRKELWQNERDALVPLACRDMGLLAAVGKRLERVRYAMHMGLGLSEPPEYVSASMDNLVRLCDDIDALTIALILRARGLTCESDESLAEHMLVEFEEDMFGHSPNAKGH